MSCAEVMYHPQPYGASQYLPNPVAAATCPTAYYHPAPQPGQGDIGSVVDEHFSRALGQASTFHPESAISKSKMGLTPLWRDSSALSSQRSSFPTSFWTSSYQPPPAPCLGGVHPDFQVTAPPGTFTAADPSPWPGHSLHQTGPAPPPPTSESWHYPLASQPGFLPPSVTSQRQMRPQSPLLPQRGLEPFTEQWTSCQVWGSTQVYSIKTRARNHHGTDQQCQKSEFRLQCKSKAHREEMLLGFSILQWDMRNGKRSVRQLTLGTFLGESSMSLSY
ncbi:transcription cofactor vestigial-like protein 3 isoform 3-T3 [Thomomys bottae]